MVGNITDTELLIFRNEGFTFHDIGIQAGVSLDRVKHRLHVLEGRVLHMMSEGYSAYVAATTIGCGPHHVTRYMAALNKKYG